MERLTYRDENGKAWANIKNNYTAREAQEFGRIALEQLAAYEDSGLSAAEVQELSKAKEEGRLVVLPCKVWELLQKYKELTEPQGDEAETYTTGYRNGHRNGQAELIAYLLQIDTGTREAAEKALERSGQDGCGEKNKA